MEREILRDKAFGKRIIAFDKEGKYMVMFNPEIISHIPATSKKISALGNWGD